MMTVEAVDAALDEVRPFLIADGGNVEVASVSEGVVYLRLQARTGCGLPSPHLRQQTRHPAAATPHTILMIATPFAAARCHCDY